MIETRNLIVPGDGPRVQPGDHLPRIVVPASRWLGIPEIVRRHFAGLGDLSALKHAAEWFGPSERWSLQRHQDFWRGAPAQVGSPSAGSQLLRVLDPSVYYMPDFRAFQAQVASMNEIIRQPLYHYRAYAAGGQVSLTFFDQTEGTATNGRNDTNMVTPNLLPGNTMHLITAVRAFDIAPFADVSVANAVAVAAGETLRLLQTACRLELTISEKPYLILAPLIAMPQGCGVGTFVTAGAAAATTQNFSNANNGHPSDEAMFNLKPPIAILPTRNFNATAFWQAAVAVTTAHRFGVMLDGLRMRPVQ